MANAWLAAAALIAGCAHRPELYGVPVPDGCSADGPKGSEACMAWWIDQNRLADWPLLANPALARYVDGVANRVARAAGDSRTWTVRLLDVGAIQAEANVGTTLYITRGALVRLRDEAELAGVLGHEIGHVMAGHERESIIDGVRGRDSIRDLTGQRDDELQADELAVLYTAKAGYDATAVERMLRALAAGDPPDDPERGVDPHPRWNVRLTRVQAFASWFHGGVTRATEYQTRVRGLVVGEDPRRDAIVDRAAVFAGLDIAITLPPGYKHASASDNQIDIVYPDDNEVALRVIPARARSKVNTDGKRSFVLVPVGESLLVITALGDASGRLVSELRDRVRAPTTAERARLIPTKIELGKRGLWPEDTTEPKPTE